MTRISEPTLILPVLYLLSARGDTSTSELIELLRNLLHPSGEDLEKLSGRADDKFSQKVCNLKSHDTLVGKGLAQEIADGDSAIFSITQKGRELYESRKHNLSTLFTFPLEDTEQILSDILEDDSINVLPEDELFSEGGLTKRTQKIRARSAKLREAAIKHYSVNDVIIVLRVLLSSIKLMVRLSVKAILKCTILSLSAITKEKLSLISMMQLAIWPHYVPTVTE